MLRANTSADVASSVLGNITGSTLSESQVSGPSAHDSGYQYSKFVKKCLSFALCKVLRHTATKFGINMASDGFVLLEDVLKLDHIQATSPIHEICLQLIQEIVDTSNKKRFTLKFDENGKGG